MDRQPEQSIDLRSDHQALQIEAFSAAVIDVPRAFAAPLLLAHPIIASGQFAWRLPGS